MMDDAIDPATLEVMRNALQSIAEEMGAALVRTAFSTNIKDRMDCSTAVYTREGKLVSQAEHMPLHLGLMPSVVQAVLQAYPPDRLEPGDVVIINDPYISGSHLPDICIISPVYWEGELVALLANLAHHVDVGGMTPGSMPVGAVEIFQEGLRIPPTKLCKRRKLDEELLQLILANVRTPDETRGDLQAQLAANNVGERRLHELMKKHGQAMVFKYMQAILDYSERRMRAMIAQLPPGHYTFTDYLESDGIVDEPIPIRVAIAVESNDIKVDFSGTSAATRGPVNCTRPVTLACVYYAIKSVVDPGLPSNEGAYRPIHVVTPPGSVVNPDFPAAVCQANINTAQRIVDAVLGALAHAVPDRVTAASSGSMNLFTIGGIDPGRGCYYSYVETCGGGQGAMHNQDGMDGVHTNMTNTRNTPVEVIEATYPLRVERYALVPDSGGPGRWRGGLGIVREITIVDHQARATISTERRRRRPWGLSDGKPGGASASFYETANGQVRALPTMTSMDVESDSALTLVSPGGGGMGCPLGRDVELVKRDVIAGFVSVEGAERDYGVVLDPESGEVDEARTAALREQLACCL